MGVHYGNLESEVEPGLELGHSGMGCWHCKQHLNHYIKCLYLNKLFLFYLKNFYILKKNFFR